MSHILTGASIFMGLEWLLPPCLQLCCWVMDAPRLRGQAGQPQSLKHASRTCPCASGHHFSQCINKLTGNTSGACRAPVPCCSRHTHKHVNTSTQIHTHKHAHTQTHTPSGFGLMAAVPSIDEPHAVCMLMPIQPVPRPLQGNLALLPVTKHRTDVPAIAI